MKTVPCIFCEHENSRAVIQENGYTGRQCSECNLIYISPRPDLDEIETMYGHDDAYASAHTHISAELTKRLNAKHTLAIITSFCEQGTILEVGAGAGYFLDEARKLGFEPYGSELNPIQAKFIRDSMNMPCEMVPLASSPFGGRKFDVVYHCDVISHFHDPLLDFAALWDMTKEGGWLVFETGNLAEVNHRYFRYYSEFQYPDHLFFFSVDNLKDLLARTGFELVEIHRYSILAQLIVLKTFKRLHALLRGEASRQEPSKNHGGNATRAESKNLPPPPPSKIKELLKTSWDYLNFVLRYKIGAVFLKTARPQTIIIVARKKERPLKWRHTCRGSLQRWE